MQFLYPWALLSLLPIVAAAFWALRRPMQKVMPVGSLRLWERAVASLGPAARKSRYLTASWLLLLAGAAAAGIALSRPVYYAEAPARRVAIAVWPSAELAGLPEGTLAEAAGAFLRRLSPEDRVRLILPTALGSSTRLTTGGSDEFITPRAAARRINEIPPLPVAAEDLTLPTGGKDVQHLYRFAPATLKMEDGPGITTIALPARPGNVTFDAFAVSGVGEKSVQVFAAVRNHAAGPKRGEVAIAGEGSQPVTLKYDLPAGGRQSFAAEITGRSDYYFAVIAGQSGPGTSAFAVRRRRVVADVAIIGRPDPLVRRFVRKHPALRLVSDPAKADAVIAIGADAPAGIPALVIDPPAPPTGWREGKSPENFALRDADLLADHPILAHVDLSAVAVRQAASWQPVAAPKQQRLVSIGPDALVLAQVSPPRVWIAFDTAVENTNFAMTESFVIFLANVFKFLVPHARSRTTYEYVTPLAAGHKTGWKPVELLGHRPTVPGEAGPLPRPGLYRDADSVIHAVSLTGLKSAAPRIDPLKRIAEISLPEPQPLTQGRELWGFLVLAAALCWMAGWTIRLW